MIVFDVIIVSYNAGEKLLKTVDSILTQRHMAQEDGAVYRVVLKDAESTDDSVANLRRHLMTYDRGTADRVQILTKKDRGIYDAMNEALDACFGSPGHAGAPEDTAGHFVYFINCGDTLASPEVLHEVAVRIESDKGDTALPVIYYGDIFEEKTGERVASNPVIDAFACYRHVPCHQACFYDARLFLKERFDTSLVVRADYDHFLKSFFRYHARCVYLPAEVAHYEGGGFSETAQNRARSKEEHGIVVRRYMSRRQIARYRRRMLLTLQPLRTKLAENRITAGVYNAVRALLYRLRRNVRGQR